MPCFFMWSQILSFGLIDASWGSLYYYDNVSAAFWYYWVTFWILVVYPIDLIVFFFAWPYYLVKAFLLYAS